jgi:hypothetical protein
MKFRGDLLDLLREGTLKFLVESNGLVRPRISAHLNGLEEGLYVLSELVFSQLSMMLFGGRRKFGDSFFIPSTAALDNFRPWLAS